MNDERIAEALAYAMGRATGGYYDHRHGRAALEQLRADGFDVYRPDECIRVELRTAWESRIPGDYRLVPVGEGTDE